MSDGDVNELTREVGQDDHRQGSDDAPVTLVEYGDYQCSFCGAAYPVVKKAQEAMGADLRFVFRNFPLTQIHEHAQKAAEAAEAAAAQDGFWPYHDLLFEHQDALGRADLLHYAEELKLDARKLAHEVDSDAHVRRIRADFMSGVESGVNGTPTFYINGIRFDGSAEFDALIEAMRAAMP